MPSPVLPSENMLANVKDKEFLSLIQRLVSIHENSQKP